MLFLESDEKSVVITATKSIKDAFGILPKHKTFTIEEMDESALDAAAEHVMDI